MEKIFTQLKSQEATKLELIYVSNYVPETALSENNFWIDGIGDYYVDGIGDYWRY